MPINPLFEKAYGQSLASPRAIASLTARTARPGTQPSMPEDLIQAPEPQESPEQPGIASRLGHAALNTVAAVGNVLDLPGSSVRDLLSGRNPFDQWLDPFGRQAETNRVSGREMLRNVGLAGKEDTWGNFIGGLGVELATDPLTYFTPNAFTKAGKAFADIGVKKLNPLAKEIAETGGKLAADGTQALKPKSSSWIGGQVAKYGLTPKKIFEHAETILGKKVKNTLDQSIQGTFKAAPDGKTAFNSLDDLKQVDVPAEKSAWAMVDDGNKIHVYRNPKDSAEWAIDPELTRKANDIIGQTALGATPRKAYANWSRAMRASFGKNMDDAQFSNLLNSELNSPLRHALSFKVPLLMKDPLWHTKPSSSPEETWDSWINKQPDMPEGNQLPGGGGNAGPSASGSAPGPSSPKPKPSAAPVRSAAQDAAEAAAMSAAQDEAAARAKFSPQQGRDVLKQLGKSDKDLDTIGDSDVAKVISKYGLINDAGDLITSKVGENANRVLHQAARTFGPKAVTAFPVVEQMAKTWAKLNDAHPDDYFKTLKFEAGDDVTKQGNWTGQPLQEAKDAEGAVHIMRMGERVITAMKSADIDTFMHEIGHDARSMFSSKMQKNMEKAIGAHLGDGVAVLDSQTGRWTVEAEEAFANQFEHYMANGSVPKGSRLGKVFQQIKDWIVDTWKTMRGQPTLRAYVHPELQKVFDSMLTTPKAAKGAKSSKGATAAAANAADAIDTQVDEAASAKPLQESQAGSEMVEAPNAIEKATGLPPLKPGYSRFVHLGRPGMEDSYKQGLDYSSQGVVHGTSRNWDNEAEVLYHSDDPRFAPSTAYVYDVPIDETRKHFSYKAAPGKLPGEYYVGSVTREQADAMREAAGTMEKAADIPLEKVRAENWDDGSVVNFYKSPFEVVSTKVESPNGSDIKNAQKKIIDIQNLKSTQSDVTDTGLAKPDDNSKGLPLVVKSGGVEYIQDGHHRLTKKILGGETSAEVRYIDLDAKAASKKTAPENFKLDPNAAPDQLADTSREQSLRAGIENELYNKTTDATIEGSGLNPDISGQSPEPVFVPHSLPANEKAAAFSTVKNEAAQRWGVDPSQIAVRQKIVKGGVEVSGELKQAPKQPKKVATKEIDAYHGTNEDAAKEPTPINQTSQAAEGIASESAKETPELEGFSRSTWEPIRDAFKKRSYERPTPIRSSPYGGPSYGRIGDKTYVEYDGMAKIVPEEDARSLFDRIEKHHEAKLQKQSEIDAYHGTNADFNEFRDTGTTYSFSTDRNKAEKYAKSRSASEGGDPRVIKRKLTVSKVFDTSNPEDMAKIEAIRGEPITEIEQLQISHLDDLKSMGYDAIKHGDEIQVFDRSQIKPSPKTPKQQTNPIADLANKAQQPEVPKSNVIQDAAKEPTPIKEIPYSKNPVHNKELNRIHQSLAETIGDDAAKAITPLVQEFVEAGNDANVLKTTIESMSPEEMAGLAAKIAADKDGAANELLQIAYHGTPHVFAPEMLVRMPDGSEKYLKAGEAIPEGAEAVQNFPLGRFDLSRVSTGEGRGVEGAGQAYGFGAYAAQREGLARNYKETLAGNQPSKWTYRGKGGDDQIAQQVLEWLNKTSASVQQVTDRIRSQIESKANLARKVLETQNKVIESIDNSIKAAEAPSSWSSTVSQSGKKEYTSTSGFTIKQRETGDGWVAQHTNARSILKTGGDVESLKKWADSEGTAEAIEVLRERKTAVPENYKREIEAIESAEKDLKKLDTLKPSDFKREGPGALYKLDVPEDDEVMFWDKPFSEQPPKVQEGLRKLGIGKDGFEYTGQTANSRANQILNFSADASHTNPADHIKAAKETAMREAAERGEVKLSFMDSDGAHALQEWVRDSRTGSKEHQVRKIVADLVYTSRSIDDLLSQKPISHADDVKRLISELIEDGSIKNEYRGNSKNTIEALESVRPQDFKERASNLKGENIYEQLMESHIKESRAAIRKEVEPQVKSLKDEIRRLVSNEPGTADEILDIIDDAVAAPINRTVPASEYIYKKLADADIREKTSGKWVKDSNGIWALERSDGRPSEIYIAELESPKVSMRRTGNLPVVAESSDGSIRIVKVVGKEEYIVRSDVKNHLHKASSLEEAISKVEENQPRKFSLQIGHAEYQVTRNNLDEAKQAAKQMFADDYGYNPELLAISQKIDKIEAKIKNAGVTDFAAKKAASKKLYSVGIKGNAVPENFQRGGNKKGNYNFVVFDDKDIKILDRLEQAGKGSVTFKETGEAAIKIVTGKGDASTAVHELSHVFRRNLKPELMQRAEKALEQQLQDKDTIKNILGGKSDAVLKDANGNWTREAEEVWARLFEKYVREGKAPTNALKEAFEALKKMMINVYKTLVKSPEINAKINPELRNVFDEMLGKKPKASSAKAPKAGVNPLLVARDGDTAVANAPADSIGRALPTSPDEIAKAKIDPQTETPEFKRWFGDWKNTPENARPGRPQTPTNPLVQQAAQAPQPKAAMNNPIQEAAKELIPAKSDQFANMTMEEYHAIEDPELKRAAYSSLKKEDGVWFGGMKVDPLRHKNEIIKALDGRHAARTAAVERAKDLQSQNIPLEEAVRELIGSDAVPRRSYEELIDELNDRVIDNKTSELARAMDWKPSDTAVAKATEVPMSRELPTSPDEIAKAKIDPQTETPEFKRWFGDWKNTPENASKVVDESGKPLVVYHGTRAGEFDSFSPNQHFGSIDAAHSRLDDIRNESGSSAGSRIAPVYLDIKNPKQLEYDAFDEAGWESEISKAKSEGYDGIKYPNEVEGGDSYIVFKPSQIKSATANSGEFNPRSSSITDAPQMGLFGQRYKAGRDKISTENPLIERIKQPASSPGQMYLDFDAKPISRATPSNQPLVNTPNLSGVDVLTKAARGGEAPAPRKQIATNPLTDTQAQRANVSPEAMTQKNPLQPEIGQQASKAQASRIEFDKLVQDAESVLGPAARDRLTDIKKLPPEKAAIFEKMIRNIDEGAVGDAAKLDEELKDAIKESIGREPTQAEIDKVDAWLSQSDLKYQTAKANLNQDYQVYRDKVSDILKVGSSTAKRPGASLFSILRTNGKLADESARQLADDLAVTPAIFRDGFEATEDSVRQAIKESTGRDISQQEALAVVATLESETATHQKIIEKVREAHGKDSIYDRNEGGAPGKARPPFVGGKALEDMPLKSSIGEIDHYELARAMPGASDDEIAKMAQGLRDSGVAVTSKEESKFKPGMTPEKQKAEIKEQVDDLIEQKKNLPPDAPNSQRRELSNKIEDLKQQYKNVGKKVDADDESVKSMYIRMNALKMLAGKAANDKTQEALLKIAKEVKDKITTEEMSRAQKTAKQFVGKRGIKSGNDDDVMGELLLRLNDLVDNHNPFSRPRIANTTFFNQAQNAANELTQHAIGKRLKSVTDVSPDVEKSEEMMANVVKRSPTEDEALRIKVTDTLHDNSWKNSLSESDQKIVDMMRAGASSEEAAQKLGMNPEAYKQQFEQVADKLKEAAEARMSLDKPNAPQVAEEAIQKHKLAQATWGEILSAVKGKGAKQTLMQALDVGENLFMASAPARTMLRLFDKSVYGAQSYEAQDLARKRFRAYERSLFEFREILAPIAEHVGQTGMFDHKTITAQLVRAGKTVDEASKEAMRMINARNDDIIKFFEAKGDYNLTQSLYNQTPEQLQEFQNWLASVKSLFPEMIKEQRSSGLGGKELIDDLVNYFPRIKSTPDGSFRATKSNSLGQILIDASQDSQRARKDYFRNVKGGTPLLNRMSMDPAISGIGHDEAMLGKGLSDETLNKAMAHIEQNYMHDILPPKMFKNGKPTKEGLEQLRQIAGAMAQLPKAHAEQQIPVFGNNFMRNIATYVEEHFTKRAIALAGQDLAINNMTANGAQQYYLSKLLEATRMDNHEAYMNVIRGTKRLDDYNRFVADYYKESIKNKWISINEKGQIVSKVSDTAYDSLDDWVESTLVAKKYADEAKLGVSQESFEAATYFMKPWSTPKEIGMVKQAAAASLNLFKSMVTLPFPAFHVRNFLSGQVQNYFFGAHDPTGTALGRYTKPIKQAIEMRNGQAVKNIHKELPKELVDDILKDLPGAPKMTDVEKDTSVTEWLRRQVFKFGITGDKQGYAAEQIGDAVSDMINQLPGARKRDKSNWWGLKPAIIDPTTNWKQKANPFAFEGSAYPTINKTPKNPRGELDAKRFSETTFVPGAVGSEMSLMVEDTNRIAPFLAFIKQGVSPEEAARRVQAIQFDYSRLSETDKAIKQFVPFWTFTSRSTALLVTDLLTNPGGKQAWSIRAANRAQDPQSPIPEHIRRGVAIPLGKGADGEDRYLSGFGLAWEDPLELMSFIHGDAKATAASAFSKLRPEAQMLGEAAFGRSAFFDRDFNDLDPQLGRLRDNLAGKENKGLAEPLAGSQALEFLVGKSPAARAVATGNKLLDNRKSGLEKLLNTASGVKITDVNQEAADRIRIQQAADQLKELGGREVTMSYLPDWKKERMTAEELQKAQELQKMINSIKSDQRERKKQAQVQSMRSVAGGQSI